MAKTAMKIKQQRKQKFSTREYNRCRICVRQFSKLVVSATHPNFLFITSILFKCGANVGPDARHRRI